MLKKYTFLCLLVCSSATASVGCQKLLQQYLSSHEKWDYDWTTAIFLYGAQTYLNVKPAPEQEAQIEATYTQLAGQIPSVTTPDLAALSLAAQSWKKTPATAAIIAASEKYFTTEPLNAVGALDHVGARHWTGWFYPSSVWADSVIMYVLNGQRLALRTGDTAKVDFFLHQAELLHRLLLNPTTGLYKHAYFVGSRTTVPEKFHWARGNLWMSLGLLELISGLSPSHPSYAKLRDHWTAHLTALLRYYVPGKGLRTLLDDSSEESYFEASATALLAYVLLKGDRLGLLLEAQKKSTSDVVRVAQSFLKTEKDTVLLQDISGPTTALNWDWYYTHVVGKVENESYGVGSYLLLCSEL